VDADGNDGDDAGRDDTVAAAVTVFEEVEEEDVPSLMRE
jgi:hypothetical protein